MALIQQGEEEATAAMARYSEVRRMVNQMQEAATKAVRDLIGEDLHAKVQALRDEHDARIAKVSAEVLVPCEDKLKKCVIALGESVKGSEWSCQFVRGDRQWDSAKLDGYAVSNPEILQFSKDKAPTTRIVAVKQS